MLRKTCICLSTSLIFFFSSLYAQEKLTASQEAIMEIFQHAQSLDESKTDSMRIYAQDIIKKSQKEGFRLGEVSALRLLGWAEGFDGNMDKSTEIHLKMLAESRKYKLPMQKHMAYSDLGYNYMAINQLGKAKAVYQEAIADNDLEFVGPVRASVYFNNLGIIFRRLSMPDSALIMYRQSMKLKEKAGDLKGIANQKINLSALLISQQRYGEAEKLILENLEYLKTNPNKGDQWSNLLNLVGVKTGTKAYTEAKTLLDSCLNLATELKSELKLFETHEAYSELYKVQGDFKNALEEYKKAIEYREKYANEESTNQINELQETFNAQEREQENRLLSTQLNAEKQKKIFLVIGLILLATLAMAIGISWQKNQKKNRQLAHQNELITLQKNKMAELNTEKNKLISLISHDLRTPFQTIKLWNKTLQENLQKSPEKVAEAAGIIAKTAEYGQSMVNRILDIEQMDIHTHQVNLVPTPVNSLLQELIEDFAPAATGKQIVISYSSTLPQNLETLTDPALLRRATENLISNALKFSHVNSRVEIHSEEAGSGIRISVRDYGIGIAAEDQPKLFTAYGKTSSLPTGGEDSSGLGLSSVKRIMDELGGKVSVESEAGKGSVFTLTLP